MKAPLLLLIRFQQNGVEVDALKLPSFLDLVVDPCGLDLLVDTATTLPDPPVDCCLASAHPTNSKFSYNRLF